MTVEPQIYGALAAVMADVTAVPKGDKNQAQNFSFRGIDSILNAVGPALRTHRVVVLPLLEEVETTTVEVGKNRSRMAHVQLRVRYRFVADDGSSVDAVVPAEAFDSGDKAVSKAMSVAFRTVLIQALALPTNDPDPDAVSYERAPLVEHGMAVEDRPRPAPVAEVAPDRFVALKVATASLPDPEPVVEWVKAQHITRGSLTDELAVEWESRIDQAGAVPVGEDPF